MKKARWALLAVLFLAEALQLGQMHNKAAAQALAWPDAWLADSAFYNLWSRADQPVASGAASRSWLWGPVPFAVANEEYSESPTKRRLVLYTDKARMEINDPHADRNSQWFVTSGLLVSEMVNGQVQTGNNTFAGHSGAALPVAGDPGGASPTYATFSRLTAGTGNLKGALAASRVSADGAVSPYQGQLDPTLFALDYYDDVSRHNVPAVFRSWMLQSGTVLENGRAVQAPLIDPLYVLGRPITEAYWAVVPVNGKPTTVLMQLFERRALTYNPDNPLAWRVEMANVGQAYYTWRYGGAPPAPAVAAEVQRDGVRVRGWNWPRSNPVKVEIDLASGVAPLSGPQDVAADDQGRFSITATSNPQVEGALVYGANVQVIANAGGVTAALPLAGTALGGAVHIEGSIIQVANPVSQQGTVRIRGRDNQEWSIDLGAATIRYSEGDPAPPAQVRAPAEVSVNGIASGDRVAASDLQLLSVSKTGAVLSFSIAPDRASLRVSGTGWPVRHKVTFTLGKAGSSPSAALGIAQSDSRGNLSASIPYPPAGALPEGQLWLFATCLDKTATLAQVALPIDLPDRAVADPPRLQIIARSGEQLGSLGAYCWQKTCAGAAAVPVPGQPLPVTPGELLSFRSQYGVDPNAGLSPTSFSAQLFSYDSPPGQVTQLNGQFSFSPKGQPVHATGDVPGRPFSMALPGALPAGKYIMVVRVTWPDHTGGTGQATYGFTLTTP